ncbi:hypothetical protein NLJ89_g10043 [Agrocybe chaxingu]|uniref:Uncharacterized protein n=1 Tax=Agrocybe chaxingu TaxID=84603 RepID=A0A9W8MSH9_9AGAR|nr:hypothetical protein NLJ89_g10043 [Agrocybe chaxingu]
MDLTFDWGTPVNIPVPTGVAEEPIPWEDLKFHPAALFDLRRHLGALSDQPALFTRYQKNFRASDLSWFTVGLASCTDVIAHNSFPPEFSIVRKNTPSAKEGGTEVRASLRNEVKNLACDALALMDRAFGGVTLMIHIEGATRPGAPKAPEYHRAEVYFTKHFLQEEPNISRTVSDLVQRFIVEAGFPAMHRYERCAKALWPSTYQSTTIRAEDAPLPYPQHGLQPVANPPGSSMFVYHGKPLKTRPTAPPPANAGSSTALGARVHCPIPVNGATRGSTPVRTSSFDEYGFQEETFTPSQHQLMECFEQEGRLKSQIRDLQSALTNREKEIDEAREEISQLKREIESLNVALDGYSHVAASDTSSSVFSDPSAILDSPRLPLNVTIRSPRSGTPRSGTPRAQSPRAQSPCVEPPAFIFPNPASPSRPRKPTAPRTPCHGSSSKTTGNISSPLASSSRHADTQSNEAPPDSSVAAFLIFLADNNLSIHASAIGVLARKVAAFNWKDELRTIGIQEELLDDLMGLMLLAF